MRGVKERAGKKDVSKSTRVLEMKWKRLTRTIMMPQNINQQHPLAMSSSPTELRNPITRNCETTFYALNSLQVGQNGPTALKLAH